MEGGLRVMPTSYLVGCRAGGAMLRGECYPLLQFAARVGCSGTTYADVYAVGSIGAFRGIAAIAAVEHIVAIATVQDVISIAAFKDIVSATTGNLIS